MAVGIVLLLAIAIGVTFWMQNGQVQAIPEQKFQQAAAIPSNSAAVENSQPVSGQATQLNPSNADQNAKQAITCPAINFPGCKGDYLEVSGGRDANGCDLQPTCKLNCPAINFPGCRSGYKKVSNGSDTSGCELEPTCQAVTCPEINFP